jgi:hypothetical protein
MSFAELNLNFQSKGRSRFPIVRTVGYLRSVFVEMDLLHYGIINYIGSECKITILCRTQSKVHNRTAIEGKGGMPVFSSKNSEFLPMQEGVVVCAIEAYGSTGNRRCNRPDPYPQVRVGSVTPDLFFSFLVTFHIFSTRQPHHRTTNPPFHCLHPWRGPPSPLAWAPMMPHPTFRGGGFSPPQPPCLRP